MGADFDWKQMWRPTLQGQIWMLADREVPRAKKKYFLDSSSVISLLLFPSSVKAMYCPSPGSPQHILGWIPFLTNAELHSMKSGSCKGIPLTLTAQSSVHCGWNLVGDQKVFCVAVSKPNSLPCWIHLNKEWCLKFMSAKVKLPSLCSH